MSDLTQKEFAKKAYEGRSTREGAGAAAGYVYDPALSGKKTSVYVNPATRQVSIAHRGTEAKDRHDIVNDIALAVGALGRTTRARRAKKTTSDVKRKYAGYQVTQTGHSLGGAVAAHEGKRSGTDVVAFSRGAGVGSIGASRAPGQRDYVHRRDIVPLLSRLEKKGSSQYRVSRAKVKNPHSIDSALP
jgi:hypothetical protein